MWPKSKHPSRTTNASTLDLRVSAESIPAFPASSPEQTLLTSSAPPQDNFCLIKHWKGKQVKLTDSQTVQLTTAKIPKATTFYFKSLQRRLHPKFKFKHSQYRLKLASLFTLFSYFNTNARRSSRTLIFTYISPRVGNTPFLQELLVWWSYL